MKDFYRLVWGDGEGYACIVTPDLNGEPTNNKFFKYPEELDKIVKHTKMHALSDVWFTPVLFASDDNRRKSNAQSLSVLYGDSDTFDVEDFHLEPSIVVHTSPGKSHCYWILEDIEYVDIWTLEQYNRAISVAHPKSLTGYDTGWSLSKLLRVPGTKNHKYEEPFELWYEVNGTIYTVEEFEEAYPVEQRSGDNFKFESLHDVEIPEDVSHISLDQEALDVINTSFPEGSRSEPLYLAINNCFEAGATNEETFALIHNTPVDKWTDMYEGDKAAERLWDDIQRTRQKKQPDPTTIEVKDVHIGERDSYDFLTKKERDNLTPCFVDRFVAWSDKKTNAATDYKEAAAFIILSTVFSDFGHLNMNWGQEPLNLWFIISGGTTVDRKSTSKNQALKFLRSLENVVEDDIISDETEYIYDYSSDFSVEGMADTLLKRPHRSGVVTRDEFQGFLAEVNQKNYKSGVKETLTDWYGGWISSRIRSGNNNKKSGIPFALSFYAIGIDEQIVDQLTTDDFLSGFLPRFLWVDPTESTVKSQSITDGFIQAVGDQKEDIEWVELVEYIRNARDWWDDFGDAEGETAGIPFTDEAWNRIVKFMRDMEKASPPEALPSAERLSVSTLKCAALLAMAEAEEEATVEHVVKAIHFSSKWFGNMVNKLNAVTDTIWKKQQDEILMMVVDSGGATTLKQVYSRVRAKYTSKEFSEILSALENSGYIKQENDNGVIRIIFTGGSN